MNNKGEFCIITNTMSNQPFSGATTTTHKNFKSVSKKKLWFNCFYFCHKHFKSKDHCLWMQKKKSETIQYTKSQMHIRLETKFKIFLFIVKRNSSFPNVYEKSMKIHSILGVQSGKCSNKIVPFDMPRSHTFYLEMEKE